MSSSGVQPNNTLTVLKALNENYNRNYGASFNLDAVKAELEKRIAQAETAAKGPGH